MSESKPNRRGGRGCAVVFFLLMICVASAWGAALGTFVWILNDAGTTIEALEDFRPKIGSKVYSADGELLGEFSKEQRNLVRLSEMPLHLIKAVVATEDDIFYEHHGVRPDAILNAAIDSALKGKTRGGSTITQQVVRNVDDLQVGLERTIDRKIREAIVALQVEREFTKDEILELYLNQVFLGISANGVEAASQQYYAKSCRDLTLAESALLAGLLRTPNNNEPIHNPKNAHARRDIVLAQMLENHFITRQEYEAGIAEDMDASVVTPEERASLREQGKRAWSPNKFEAPYFVEEVRTKILDLYGVDTVFEDGLEIQTTVDMRIQRAAERVMREHLEKFDEKKRKQLEARGQLDEFMPVSGALVCIDNRKGYQGFVRAMVGGRDFDSQKFNDATQALRQPGSSVKPFVWAAAIDNGMTPSTIIVDEPFSRSAGGGQVWSPKNFDGKYHGPMTLRHALEKSVNIISIKLTAQLGMPVVRSYLKRCGITTPIDNVVGLTIALGTPDIHVIDQAVAYSTFPNLGTRYDPVMVTDIRNRDGVPRYDYRDTQTVDPNALDPAVAYVVTHMLQGVCTPDYSTGYYPTGHRTSRLERPRGGKTGTTNSSRNVWFCGFTADFTCVVWIGYRDNRPLGRGADYTGGRLACPAWTDFMIEAHEGLPVRDFDVPPGVTFYDIDRIRGTRGGNYKEAYVDGTAPPADWGYSKPVNLDSSEETMLEEL